MHFFFTIPARACITFYHHKFDPNRLTHCPDTDLVESDSTYMAFVYTCESLTTTMGIPIEKIKFFTIHCGQPARWIITKIEYTNIDTMASKTPQVRCLNAQRFFSWRPAKVLLSVPL